MIRGGLRTQPNQYVTESAFAVRVLKATDITIILIVINMAAPNLYWQPII